METEVKPLTPPVLLAEKECDAYCPICRKLLHVEKGQIVPRCCGKQMQILP